MGLIALLLLRLWQAGRPKAGSITRVLQLGGTSFYISVMVSLHPHPHLPYGKDQRAVDAGNNPVTWLSGVEGMVAMGLLTQGPIHSRADHLAQTGNSD